MSNLDHPAHAGVSLVREFHEAFGHPVSDPKVANERFGLRMEWTADEMFELARAIHEDDTVEIADAIADALYFVYGTAVEAGVHVSWARPSGAQPSGSSALRLAFRECFYSISTATSAWAISGAAATEVVHAFLPHAELALRDMARALDLPIDEVIEEVHRSNMAKLWSDGKPHYRADGKVAKPEGWTPPDIAGVLARS